MVNIFYYKKNALNFYKKKELDSFHIIKHIKIGKSPP